jgi:hypothetical protein
LIAEIIPFEPDTGNAGVGSGDNKTIIRAISYEGKRVWLFWFEKSDHSGSEYFFGYVQEKFAG